MTATLTIGSREGETLFWLLVRRFNHFSERWEGLAESEGVSFEQLLDSAGDDLRLFDEAGLRFRGVAGESKGTELTMPTDRLAAAIKRLREGAQRALFEEPDRREREENKKERRERFLSYASTCDELLGLLGADGKASHE